MVKPLYHKAGGVLNFHLTLQYVKIILEETIMTAKNDINSLPACPVETTLMLIGSKWKVLILRDLIDGKKRFGELKKSIGSVSQKVLTAQLREMESDGLVNRTVYAEVPPRVEYELSELGNTLRPVLNSMLLWGKEYKEKIESAANNR